MNQLKMNALSNFIFVLILLTIGHYAYATEKAYALNELWTLEGIFTQPESAAFDPATEHIFVSNVNDYAKDGNGFVSRVSLNGEQVELKWLEGLNSPTGLTVVGKWLYVVDYDELLKVDIKSKDILQRYAAPHEKPGLNDVVVTPTGKVFVTGSASSAIYTLVGDRLTLWKQDPALLKHANGLFEDNGKLLFGGAKWLAFDLETSKQIETKDHNLREIDGIASDGCGGYIISLLDDNRLWRIDTTGQATPLTEQVIDGIDLSFHAGKLFVPRVGNSLGLYQLDSSVCN